MTRNPETIEGVIDFLQDYSDQIPRFYESYTWNSRSPEDSHRELFDLEKEISTAAKLNCIKHSHLLKIAEWGKHPNKKKISGPDPLNLILYDGGKPVVCLRFEPVNPICIIEGRISGFGPTYSSKLLHFAVPEIYGALDTRLVRVFGNVSKDTSSYPMLDLNVTRPKKGRPSIPRDQPNWPEEYGTWVAILNYYANVLNANRIYCNHPPYYYDAGLRMNNQWLPADVETALFSYASMVL
jgi:hypothetical protein